MVRDLPKRWFCLAPLWLGVMIPAMRMHHAHAANPGTSILAEWPFDAKEAKQRQQKTAKTRNVPVLLHKQLAKGVNLSFTLIPPGRFLMGDTFADEPEVQTKIEEPFYISRHEVTQRQWHAIMGDNPSEFKAPGSERKLG